MEAPQANDATSFHVGVVGLGYVGTVTAACLSSVGHVVYGFEQDPSKIAKLKAGISPFYEPGLDALLGAEVKANRLTILRDIDPLIAELDIVLICVGTPTGPDGAHDCGQLERVCEDLASALRRSPRQKPLTIAIRSTVVPGTSQDLRTRFFKDIPGIDFAYVPEFLREGTAIKDFFDPGLVVVGADDDASARVALAVYAGIDAPKRLMTVRAAEMVKGVCNAFHALKTAFANETGSLAAACGIDPEELMSVICQDTRLNISTAYLKPGFAFGGSCLPKDIRALNHLARANRLALPLYTSILPSNAEHLHRAAERVIAAGFQRAGLIGLSFKSHTDDMRESSSLQLAAILKAASVEVRAFDPDIRAEMLHGANLRAMEEVFVAGRTALVPKLEDLLGWADSLVVTKPASPDTIARIRSSGLAIVDVTRIAAQAEGVPEP
ncbi:MAG: nucleotide sugar dehydrogenase [Acidobacteriia bacterium]|nr:nucleotide sugar dehydrogenase [Terriglobia bacterium]